ncbi:putative dinucleotide-binding enzyme [Arcanobacterium wilhelmae]|uniref:Dinucleotide-binding enzyme n=1 Tax=Arcanobacterium wilhelmae TaxID=1803177 RepID=A0ABT9N9I2_9ACTO|nr:NAD(P)-binding domain-containing protein [Arcanobacterium wilhelmae]MDP9800367.1 putative dinucleotide-binding enzyme [Arcanobacterium wilhelmae]WFN89798.1 NAD(P)-dependent oxidoreductase [Arcanobacterium wilhelmae]
MNTQIRTVGIVGAGKLGTAIGRIAAASGLEVLVYSRSNPMLELVLGSVLPAAQLVTFEELAERADVVVLAVPHPVTAQLDLAAVRGVIVDATNPWEATDTAASGITPPLEAHPELPIARTLNHISYEELVADSHPAKGSEPRAVAVRADDERALAVASELVRRFGFAPVPIPADAAELFNADGRLFGAWLSERDLKERVVG